MAQEDPRIRVLDDALVDQIAAGEVVERPSSVVKELVENALDAGAGTIHVEIEAGGTALIRVRDDGGGMGPQDARRAIRRHATSKIRALEDLHRLQTLGFRGEALPSIASVSRFTLTTRPGDAVGGTRVRIDGGAAPELSEVGAAPGTTVEVRDLFYNVPARRKFLKRPATESAHVTDVCLRTALARHDVRLVLLRDRQRAREYLPVRDTAERARLVFSDAQLTEVQDERDGIRIHALLGPPEQARSGAGGLYLFVNGRTVKDRALARAVAFAYGSVLPPGRYPAGVVHLEVDPARVDVNVHPQKAEVRFAEGRAVLETLTRLLAAELGTSAWSGPASRGASYWTTRLATDPPAPGAATAPALDTGADPWGLGAALRDGPSPIATTDGQRPQALPQIARASEREEPSLLAAPGPFGSLRVLGQVRRMLLVCEGPDGLVVLDQHAADERVRYHHLRTSYHARQVATQRLLFPERVDVSAAEVALAEERHDDLLTLGLDCTPVGPTTLAVHAVPAIVRRAAAERLLRDVLDEISRAGDRSFGDAVDMALATMACHGAIRAGDPLSPEECAALLKSMDEVGEFAGHCPHGRPVVYEVSIGELERRLGR